MLSYKALILVRDIVTLKLITKKKKERKRKKQVVVIGMTEIPWSNTAADVY